MKKYQLNLIEYPRLAPKLVFLHGLGGTHRYWLTGLDKLKKTYHVILIDLLGFGDSDKPWINYTKMRHLDALEDALSHYDKFFLVGHSLGAALSIAYSARNPKKCLGQVLISVPYFLSKNQAFRWLRQTPNGWLMTNVVTAIIACIFTRRIAGRFLPRLLKRFPRAVAEDLVKHNFLSSTTTLWQVLYHSTIPQDLALISDSIPTAWIHAKNDDSAPYETTKFLTEFYSKGELFTLEHAAHHPWLWDNSTCLQIINDTINRWVTLS